MIYGGAIEHARRNFAVANRRYAEAERIWRNNHRHNWAVAVLAQAVALQRQGISDEVVEIANALQALRVGECSRIVEALYPY